MRNLDNSIENELKVNSASDAELEGVSGGYTSNPQVSNHDKFTFKTQCAKCKHEELNVLERQQVKMWICVNCKTLNVSKMKPGSTSYCYTYTSEEYNRLIKSKNTII